MIIKEQRQREKETLFELRYDIHFQHAGR